MAGPSVCDDCREKLLDAPPETPVRVIALDRASVVLGTLARYDAQRLTREIKRRERPE